MGLATAPQSYWHQIKRLDGSWQNHLSSLGTSPKTILSKMKNLNLPFVNPILWSWLMMGVTVAIIIFPRALNPSRGYKEVCLGISSLKFPFIFTPIYAPLGWMFSGYIWNRFENFDVHQANIRASGYSFPRRLSPKNSPVVSLHTSSFLPFMFSLDRYLELKMGVAGFDFLNAAIGIEKGDTQNSQYTRIISTTARFLNNSRRMNVPGVM